MANFGKLNRKYGWKPSLPDFRRPKFAMPAHLVATPLPTSVDLRPKCPPVYDQGDLGSCTANAAAGDYEFLLMKEGKPAYTPSRLFIYYNERVLEDSVKEDSGASLSDGFKVMKTKGAPHETLWPYDVKKFTVKPSNAAYADGLKHEMVQAETVDNTNIQLMKAALASGLPIAGGFTVYESFESDAVAKTGIVPMPAKNEEALGGHAVLWVGYDDSKQWFIVRNSWGPGWGDKGYFYLPYAYTTNPDMADDFHVGQLVK